MAKTVLITGASSGIGEETARSLLAAGYTVYAGARRVDRMQSLSDVGAHLLPLDLASGDSITAAIHAVLQQSGRIDVLINNAGYGCYGALEDVPLEEARRQAEVNVFGPARLIQLVLPTMRAQGAGRIVNVTSIGGKFGGPFGSWYHAAKFAMEGLSDSLRMELHPFGIDVVVVQPGAVLTEGNRISREGLMKHAGKGAYRGAARQQLKLMIAGDEGTIPSPPGVIAKTILRAVQAQKPRTRYVTGGGARSMLWLRRALTDRAFDVAMRLIGRQVSKSFRGPLST